jgi:hypothetical protein
MMAVRIAGIPAQVSVVYFSRGCPAITNADPDSCYEAEPHEISFKVHDRRGRAAPWLARKMTETEAQQIEADLIAELR